MSKLRASPRGEVTSGSKSEFAGALFIPDALILTFSPREKGDRLSLAGRGQVRVD